MVTRNKLYRVFDKYRALLKSKAEKSDNGLTYLTNKSKNRVLEFYEKNGRWPNRRSEKLTESLLGQRFENYLSKESGSYDPHFRRIAMATGRTSNNKRKHDVRGFKKEILEFIAVNGMAPRVDGPLAGERNLRQKLDYYVREKHDMTFLGKVYRADKCHRSGIPGKFRPLINASLDVEKPLIRLVKSKLGA